MKKVQPLRILACMSILVLVGFTAPGWVTALTFFLLCLATLEIS